MCVGLAALDEPVPSPKSQRYEAIVPSESVDPADEKLTSSGSVPVVGVPAAAAVGATFGVTVISTEALAWPPALSVTVRTAL